jgi:hypothetical protein
MFLTASFRIRSNSLSTNYPITLPYRVGIIDSIAKPEIKKKVILKILALRRQFIVTGTILTYQ